MKKDNIPQDEKRRECLISGENEREEREREREDNSLKEKERRK
jgi:hypothetical protein